MQKINLYAYARMHRGDIQIFLSVIFKLDEVIYLRRRTHTCIYFKENLNWCQVLEPALNSVPKLRVLEKVWWGLILISPNCFAILSLLFGIKIQAIRLVSALLLRPPYYFIVWSEKKKKKLENHLLVLELTRNSFLYTAVQH